MSRVRIRAALNGALPVRVHAQMLVLRECVPQACESVRAMRLPHRDGCMCGPLADLVKSSAELQYQSSCCLVLAAQRP